MAFDQQTRNLLQRTVSACRNLLDAEFASQRRSIFGINDDGTAAPLETLSHLSDEDMQTARLLRDRLDHLVAGLVSQGKKEAEARKEAVGRVTREQAFTVLNRLAALRMSEEREIVLECVRQGTASEGFALFMQTAGGALGGNFESYRCYLFLLFDELATDLGVLFSRWDPAGLLFPRQEALEAVLRELNGTGTAATREDITPEAFSAIWAEDETIGWIYQYYNDQAERKKMRDESAAPRNSRELAVRNQFFTPRYVVEFLTDNTLGRIWYEMTRGDTTLKEQCRYLVRRPCEVFLKLADDDTPPSCRPWVREVRSGNLATARFDATWDEISSVALAIDGHAVAAQLGHGDVHDYASSRRERAIVEGLVDDAPLLDQWLLLFSIHHEFLRDGQAPQSDAHSRAARKAWEAWFVATRAESYESVSQEDLHNLTMPLEAMQEAHDHIFGKGTDFYPDEWIKRAWQGDLSRLETEFTVDNRLVAVAIPQTAFRKILGDDSFDPDEDDRLTDITRSIDDGAPSDDAWKLPVLWAALSNSAWNDGSGAYGAAIWDKLWPHFCLVARINIAAQSRKALSQEDLLQQPVHIPHRPLKDPRTILMLDPACGSMHFGLYAFDLFEVIYDEAWVLEEKSGADVLDRPPGMKSLHATYAGKDAFLKDVPRLIIEHNLHGIDIDPRCAQIAGLSLWLRAQKAWQRLCLRPAERPAIKRSNIVCAEPMPGERELLREFVEREFPAAERAVCLRLLEAIFDKMQLAGEAGSLLKIEEEIRSAIEDARDAWQKLATKPPELFTTTELNQLSTAPELTGLEQAVSSLTPDPRHLTTDFWERIEERIYAALRDYAEQAENGGGFQRRLFAEDAARGFAFIDVCRKRYDVALMNPPFGAASKLLQTRLEQLGFQGRDLAADFISNSLRLATARGFVGAITTRTIFFLKGFLDWRDSLVKDYGGTRCFLDIGFGVLDAAVEACAFTVEASKASFMGHYFRGLGLNSQMESGGPESVASTPQFLMDANAFTRIPRQPFAYWCSPKLLSAFEQSAQVGDSFDVLSGGNPRDDFRFIRHWVEIPTKSRSDFVPYSKGGEFAFYYFDVHLMLKWADDGKELKVQAAEYRRQLGWSPDWRALMMNYDRYFTPGITWPRRTSRLSFRFLPKGCVFGDKSPVILSRSQNLEHLFPLVGYLNTSTFNEALNLMVGSSELAQSFEVGIVKSCPLPKANEERQGAIVREVFQKLYGLDTVNEDSHAYVDVALHLKSCRSLDAAFCEFRDAKRKIVQEIVESQEELERLAHEALGTEKAPSTLSAADFDEVARGAFVVDFISQLFGVAFGRWDIRYATGEQAAPELPDPFAPLPVCPPGQLQNAQGLPARPEDVPAAYPVRIPWDGILVDDPNHPLDLERRVREVIEIIWSGQEGGPKAEAIEHEACEILGVKSLRDYFRKAAGFFADHLKRYSKSRRQAPIYWPLSTASGSYTLWIYYHRLTPDTLYKCLQQFVEPKIRDVEQDIHRLRTMLSSDEGGTKERDQLKERESLLNELKELHAELSLWAPKWKPNLNDGVLITASPLWKLFRLPKWRTALEACWKELEKGDYDWAHLAHTLWPTRVRENCKTDRSLAIAHGLEDLCEIKAPGPKKKAAKKTAKNKSKSSEQEDLL